MRNFIQHGKNIDLPEGICTSGSNKLLSGGLFVKGILIGIANRDTGSSFHPGTTIQRNGIFSIPKKTKTESFATGDPVYVEADGINLKIVKAATGAGNKTHKQVGCCVIPSPANDEEIGVLLNV